MKYRKAFGIVFAAAFSLLPAAAMAGFSQPQSASTDDPEASYQKGLRLEHRGETKAAVEAYRLAADGGHGLAQRKLGDIYGTGKNGVRRDYETSLKWYWRTQEQGLEIPKPFVYPGVRR